ncbi:hypothetical protein OU995_21225 [Roseateles sp. SL47]|uniref:hypothetical protein n=1 Tax=Roseateles sp. SL47 TaxID=2995138 RepID=UPI00226E899B|nr:hypothetical protein [Roseateles sp. SL47]WAC72068.1 hypothetical protein OU995_21225 [Roseateles sp. SL47]
MSTYGLLVRNPANLQTWFDSRAAVAGVPLDFINLPANAPGFTRSYPSFSGRTVRLVSIDMNGAVGGASIDYSTGMPRLTVQSISFPQRFLLVAS